MMCEMLFCRCMFYFYFYWVIVTLVGIYSLVWQIYLELNWTNWLFSIFITIKMAFLLVASGAVMLLLVVLKCWAKGGKSESSTNQSRPCRVTCQITIENVSDRTNVSNASISFQQILDSLAGLGSTNQSGSFIWAGMSEKRFNVPATKKIELKNVAVFPRAGTFDLGKFSKLPIGFRSSYMIGRSLQPISALKTVKSQFRARDWRN